MGGIGMVLADQKSALISAQGFGNGIAVAGLDEIDGASGECWNKRLITGSEKDKKVSAFSIYYFLEEMACQHSK
jgi:hypothetical protein